MRTGAQVRTAEPDDLPALVELCLAARSESAVGAQLCSNDADSLRHQLGALIGTHGGMILVAVIDQQPCGLLLARLAGPSLFTDTVSLSLEAIYVAADARRRGVGRALLARAVTLADEAGATDVYAAPLPGARGMLRFFARLGFAPAASHRVTTTAGLLRRLAGEPVVMPGGRRSGRGLEDLIARRRQIRATGRGPVAEARAGGLAVDQARSASITMQVNRAVASRLDSESSTTIS